MRYIFGTSWRGVFFADTMWNFGPLGVIVTLDIFWWVLVLGLCGYAICGGCPKTWDHSNAKSFMRYTVGKNYSIHGWELGKDNIYSLFVI